MKVATTPPPAQVDRSDEIHAAILAILEAKGSVSVSELAQAVGITRRHLAGRLFITNLRLAGERHPSRIQKTFKSQRCYWSLQPLSR